MENIIRAAISRARMMLTVLLLLLVAGFYAYSAIPKESSPDIDIPQIYVSMGLEGISPEDSERLLLRPIEQELSRIEGVKEMKASGYQGGGYVLLEFWAGFDKDKALDDVQKAVDRVRPELPQDVDEPNVTEVNFSLFPVLVVTLSGDVPERTLLRLARNLQDKVEGVSSVLEAGIAGDRDELVEIIVDPEHVESYGLNGAELLNFFGLSNRLVAAGNLDTGQGRFAIEVPGLFDGLEDILTMPLKTVGDSTITAGDIAEVRRTFKDPESFARLDGKPAIALEIVKRSGENVIDTIAAVKEVVEKERQLWPSSVQVTFSQDQSKQIQVMLRDLENNLISAIILVLIISIWYMGLRPSLLVVIAIPGSFLAGILMLYLSGFTVNVVVLFSLIFSAGMVVDSATIVAEYADRKMLEGINRVEAYVEAATRMFWPIVASTATIIAAFAPLLFWPGIVGEFMKYMPLTLIAVLFASLIFALLFTPVLGVLFGKPAQDDPEMKAMVVATETGDFGSLIGLTGWYARMLGRALKRPGRVIGSAFAVLVGVIILYGFAGKGVEFFPNIEPELATVLVHARGNLSVFEQDALVREVEKRIISLNEEIGGIEFLYTRSGKPAQQGSDLAEDVIGQLQMQFRDWDKRPPADEVLTRIREATNDLPGLYIETRKMEEGPPTGKAVQVQIASRFPDKLNDATETVLRGIKELGDFRDVEDSRPMPGIKWEMEVDRAQAKKFGLDITQVGYYIRMVTNGLEVAEYRPDDSDEEIDIVIRHEAESRTLDQLDRVRIETGNGSVPVSSFVMRDAKPATGVISRSDQRRIITVKADLPPGINTSEKVEQVKKWLLENRSTFDPSIEITFKGEDEQQQESQDFLTKAFLVALFMIAIILLTQFNSFYSTFLILTAVIMSTIGVMLGLILTQQPFGIIMSGIGVIALAGIIVNNNIVLIDTFDYLKRKYGDSLSAHEIVMRTGVQRLRPVLLTTITTVIGLLPMVFQTNIDFITREVSVGAPSTQWWVQLSTAICFGLSFSTVLTLIVTPSALLLRENFLEWKRKGGKWNLKIPFRLGRQS